MSATSPQAEGKAGSTLVKWLLLAIVVLGAAGALAFAGTSKVVKSHRGAADFLAEIREKPGVKATPSGLLYEVLRPADGPKPIESDMVAVHYEGRLADGTIFDSSYGGRQPAVFRLNQVIPGWTEGVQLMSVGSKYRLYVPPELGYGAEGAGGGAIPPNAALVFDVELLGIAPRQ